MAFTFPESAGMRVMLFIQRCAVSDPGGLVAFATSAIRTRSCCCRYGSASALRPGLLDRAVAISYKELPSRGWYGSSAPCR